MEGVTIREISVQRSVMTTHSHCSLQPSLTCSLQKRRHKDKQHDEAPAVFGNSFCCFSCQPISCSRYITLFLFKLLQFFISNYIQKSFFRPQAYFTEQIRLWAHGLIECTADFWKHTVTVKIMSGIYSVPCWSIGFFVSVMCNLTLLNQSKRATWRLHFLVIFHIKCRLTSD